MKRYKSKIQLCIFSAMLFTGACTKDGINTDEMLGIQGEARFKPISNIEVKGGYGDIEFKWTLPENSASLFYIKLEYDGQKPQIMSPYTDSLRIADLEPGNYKFNFTSVGPEGESKIDTIESTIIDWRLEPPAVIESVRLRAIKNRIQLSWQHPDHRTYQGVVVKLFREEGEFLFVDSLGKTKDEEPVVNFPDQAYETNYKVVYYSFSEKEIHSKPDTMFLAIGEEAPEIPLITHDKSRIDFAYNAELRWQPTEGMDSIRIEFDGLNDTHYVYQYHLEEYAYVTGLPGGTVDLHISVKGKNSWSLPETMSLTTKHPKDTYIFRAGNYPAGGSGNKLEDNFATAVGNNSGVGKNFKYPFENLLKLKEFHMQWKPIWIDEMELFINIEKFTVGGSGMQTPGFTGGHPDLQQFIDLINRLPKLSTLTVYKGYIIFEQLKAEFSNSEKYPNLQFIEK